MKIARNPGFSDRPVEWYSPSPAPSLRELARPKGVTEGVSSDGSTGPMIYTPPIINSEIFEWLRSSGYTPSASHSLSSSLREGAGNAIIQPGAIHRTTQKPERCGRFSSPLRKLREFYILPFIGEGWLRATEKSCRGGSSFLVGVIGRGRPGRCLGRQGRSGRPRHRLGVGWPGCGGGLPPPLAVWRRSGRHGWGRGKRGVQVVQEV